MSLRESVIVTTLSGELQGYLFVGADGLPELLVDCGCPEVYRPATVPAAWYLRYTPQVEPPILYAAWRAIEDIRQQIVNAQWLQAEREEDDAKERARESEAENRIAQEIEERRGDEKVG